MTELNQPTILRNSATNLIGYFCSAVFTMVLGVFLARWLGVELQGKYFIIIAGNAIIASLFSFSMDQPNIYHVAKDPTRLPRLHTQSLVCTLLFAAATVMLFAWCESWLSATLFRGVERRYMWLMVLMAPVVMYKIYCRGLLVGMNRLFLVNQLKVAESALLLAGSAAVLWWRRADLLNVILVWCLVSLVIALYYLWYFVVRCRARLAFNGREFLAALGFGARAHYGNFLYLLYSRFDLLLVNLTAGLQSSGVYALTNSYYNNCGTVVNAFQQGAIPRIAGPDRERAQEATEQTARFVTAILTFLLVGIAIFAYLGFRWIYGPAYQDAIVPLLIIMCGLYFLSADMLISSYVATQLGRPELVSIVPVVTAGFYALNAFYWLPRHGMIGMAATIVLTNFCSFVLVYLVYFHFTRRGVHHLFLVRIADLRALRLRVVAAWGKVQPWLANRR